MTKSDRAMFEMLAAQVTALAAKLAPTPAAASVTPSVTPTVTAPTTATATALPAWVPESVRQALAPLAPGSAAPVAAPVAAPEEKAPFSKPPAGAIRPIREWTFAGYDVAGSGNLVLVYQSTMKNGGFFRSTIPADLVSAIQRGSIAALPR